MKSISNGVHKLNNNRKGDYIETYSGIAFYPLDPKLEEIVIEDIAHALSLQCRFTGHTKYFYSVAQHSINVANLIKQAGYNSNVQLYGLLHDASEAYLTDIASPVKPYLANYREFEEVLQNAIYSKFGVKYLEKYKNIIKYFDYACLHIEGSNLMPNKTEWAEKVNLSIDLARRNPNNVKDDFLEMFKELWEV